MAEAEITPYKYDVKDLNVVSVTVYKDRAEVKRSAKVTPEKGGPVEVIIYGLSVNCDLDSIRVEGTGKATITEVTSVEKLEEKKKTDESEAKSIQEEITELRKQIKVVEAEKERVAKLRAIVVGLGNNVQTPSRISKDEESASTGQGNLLTEEGLNGVVKFLSLYGDQLKYCDVEAFRLEDELESLNAKIAVLNNKRAESSHTRGSVEKIRQVSVLLDVKEAGEITLAVSYLVTGAKWEPKYDIRAFSADSVVKITYFGLITQKTGEDWKDAKLFLSTAQPSVGGEVPELPSQTVNFERVPAYKTSNLYPNLVVARVSHATKSRSFRRKKPKAAESVESDDLEFCCMDMEGTPALTALTSEVQSGALSTSFEVARSSTIPSDNTEHKVTVAMFDLKAIFEHFSAPKKVGNAFLKAKLTNDSPYLILSGPSSIFMDNSFIAKSILPSVNPSEKFECSLGVDFAVRVTYKPCNKKQETSGVISKAIVNRYKQVIEVKNTHQHDIRIQVQDQLPRSEDQKIKVTLVAPVIPKEKDVSPDSPAFMNASGNIVWNKPIKGGATESFLLHYTIERPADKTLEFSEV